MCEPASFVVTKDKVFWSKTSDSHDRIIQEYQLYQYGVRGSNIVKVEISPRDRTFTIPLDKWDFYLDEDNNDLPEWFDQEDIEKRCRVELCRWAQAKLFVNRDALIYNTRAYICGNSKIKAFNSKIDAYNDVHIEAHESNVASYDNVVIDAYNNNYIYSFSNSKVKAQDYNHIEAYGHSKISCFYSNFVEAYHYSQISVSGKSAIFVYDNAKIVEANNGAIIKYMNFTENKYKPQNDSDAHII
jgi:hypothetical protein